MGVCIQKLLPACVHSGLMHLQSGRWTWSGTPLAQARVSAALGFSAESDPHTRRAGRMHVLNGFLLFLFLFGIRDPVNGIGLIITDQNGAVWKCFDINRTPPVGISFQPTFCKYLLTCSQSVLVKMD